MKKIVNTSNTCVLYLREETRKNVFMGERGPMPPPNFAQLFSTDQKRGRGFEPPQIFGQATKTYRQRAGKCWKLPHNAAKRFKTPQKAEKRRKTPQNATKRRN
jgi:hypothetical protein